MSGAHPRRGGCPALTRAPGRRFSVETLRLDPGAATLQMARRGTAFELTAYGADGKPLGRRVFELPSLAGSGSLGVFVLSHDAMQLSDARFTRLRVEAPGTPNPNKTP